MASSQVAVPQKYSHMTFYKHELRPLTPELQKKAEVELNELVSRRDEDLHDFRNMVAKETDLHANMSDAFLIKFLRARKYNKERALKLIKNYYKGKKNFKYLLNEGLVPSQVKHVFEKNVLTVLSHPDPQGRAILLMQTKLWNPSEFPLDDILRAAYLVSEKLLEDPSHQVNGLAVIVDAERLIFQQLRQFRPMLAYALVNLVQIFFHGHNLANLHKHIPPEHLPKAQGGTMCDEFNGSEWTKLMLESEKYFVEDFQYGYHAP